MSAERLRSLDNASVLPKDVEEVLSDKKWHRVLSMSGQELLSLNYTLPWRLNILSTPKDDSSTTGEDTEGQCFGLVFSPNGWTREGDNFVCKGRIIMKDKDNKEVLAQIKMVDNVPFLKS